MKRLLFVLVMACAPSPDVETTSLAYRIISPQEAFSRDEYLLEQCYGKRTLDHKTCEEKIKIEKGWAP